MVLLVMVESMSRALRFSKFFIRKSFLTNLFYPRLLNTIRQSDYYLITDDFDSCMPFLTFYAYLNIESLNIDIAALEMVDEAYLDKEEWIKKSIRTTAKVR